MKRFVCKSFLVFFAFSLFELIILLVVPRDKNDGLYEYNRKVDLLQNTFGPRIILVGGSNVFMGTDSRRIQDSLNLNIVNFGLSAGIGIRYPLIDCLSMVKNGDIIVLQMEYSNFYNGGNGNDRSLSQLIYEVNWKHASKLNIYQWLNIIIGAPSVVIGNLNRIIRYPFRKSWDGFVYYHARVNDFGDEIEHLKSSSRPIMKPPKEYEDVDPEFVVWLSGILNEYEKAGAKIIMIPPVCIKTGFRSYYRPELSRYLSMIGRPYVVNPEYMVLDDSCSYDGYYHVNEYGVKQNSDHLIEILRKEI